MEFIIISLILGCALLLYMYSEAHTNRIIHHDIIDANFPEGFGEVKIFFISDIHRRIIHDKLIEQIKDKIDFIIIGGDLLERGVPIEQVEHNVKKLRKLGLVYFVWGNNDYEIDPHIVDALLLKNGVKILDNTAVSFESESADRLVLIGVDDMARKRERLDLALSDANMDGYKILVSHNPQIIRKIREEDQISLVLSGHTHGGQIRLFGFGLYPKGEISKIGLTTLLVSNGYGTTALPLRLGARAETHILTLRKENTPS